MWKKLKEQLYRFREMLCWLLLIWITIGLAWLYDDTPNHGPPLVMTMAGIMITFAYLQAIYMSYRYDRAIKKVGDDIG